MDTTQIDTALVDRLTQHRTLGSAPREELEWLAAHGEFRRLETNQIITPKGGRPEGMLVVFTGHASVSVDRGAGKHKIIEWRGGDIMGLLPYSRLQAPPADAIAEETTEGLLIHEADIPQMIAECHQLTSILVHVMVDRARQVTSSDLHDEKMVSLGKLAAGLAHELNNPASAVARSAKQLTGGIAAAETAARALGAAGLDDAQRVAVDAARDLCLSTPATIVRTPIERADREDSIADWLDAHSVDSMIAEPLAETAITIEALDELAGTLDGPALDAALRSIAAGCTLQGLAREIEDAAFRISELVTAVKGFTYMDQSTSHQPVNVGEGIVNTLAVLKAKARAKSLGVVVTVEDGLPAIDGFGGELNQVWANLIDNAIDAARESGAVEVSAVREGENVVVRVIDDGPGVPQEIRDRIFDPFFTTKPIGKGTGLGLDITRRLILRHNGVIDLESQPGRTVFSVSLPITANSNGSKS